MKHNNDHSDDMWYHQVQDTMLHNTQQLSFSRDWCEVKEKINECVKSNNTHLNNSVKVGLHYDGYLHFPELGILILSLILKYIDVHAFGKEDSMEVPSQVLTVIAGECAQECIRTGIVPDGKTPF